MVNNEILISLFAATRLIIFMYVFLALINLAISLGIIFKAREEFTTGKIRSFMEIFSITIAFGFFYAVWNIFLRLDIVNINNQIMVLVIDNLIMIIFIMLLIRIAFLSRNLVKSFGFRKVGDKVSKLAKR